MSDDPLAILRAIAADPYTGWNDRYPGRRAIGTLCTYAPAEVLHAAEFVPVRLVPAGAGVSGADKHLQTYTCAVARGVLATATAGGWDWLAGVVFPHTCDTMQALADVWRTARPNDYVGTLVGPVAVESPAAAAYLVAELRRFVTDLETHFGVTVSDDALRASIRVYNENRRLLADLRASESLPYSDWLRVALAGLAMPVEEHTGLLTALAQGSPLPPGDTLAGAGGTGVRVVLVGAVLDDPALPALIEELGGVVADDDVCTGRRACEALVDEDIADPVVALAQRELTRPPCPARYAPGQPRSARLLGLVQDSRADGVQCPYNIVGKRALDGVQCPGGDGRALDGVIFLQQKFCEPHAFDLPPLRAALEKAGLPHLTLEMEGSAIDGALRTRVQAFLEMLR